MSFRKTAILIVLIIIMLAQTGCWNNWDLTRLAIATAVGIDKAEDGQVEVSVQIVKPSSITTQSGGSGGGGGDKKGYFVITSKGSTIFEAIRSMLNSIDRRVFYSNVQVIIFGEDMAKQGIMETIDFFIRQHETQPRAYVIVAKGCKARDIFDIQTEMEDVPAIHILQTIENKNISPTIRMITLIDLCKGLAREGRHPLLGQIEKRGEKGILVEGAAVFHSDKLVGWLSPSETIGYRLAIGDVTSGVINIPNPSSPGREISIETLHSRSSHKVGFENGKPVFEVKIFIEGSIAELGGSYEMVLKRHALSTLEDEYKKEVEKEINDAFKVVQEQYKSDIFGFGSFLRRHYPAYWKTVKDNWANEFGTAPVKITVTTIIRRPGLIKQPVNVR